MVKICSKQTIIFLFYLDKTFGAKIFLKLEIAL